MVRANDKLSVLSAEAPINQPLLTDGAAFFQLQEEMRTAFETTVLDLPRPMLVQHPHLVNDSHVCIVVTEFTLAATRDSIRILSWLKANAPQARVIVVANKVAPVALQEISRKDFEKSIERRVDIVVPHDPKTAVQAAKLGQPFAKTASSKILQPLTQLVKATVSAVDGDEKGEAAQSDGSLLGRIANLTGVITKMHAKPAA
jgi:pilus assembly protein CpaE